MLRDCEASASTTASGSPASGAIDGNRFALQPGAFWKAPAGKDMVVAAPLQ